MQQAVQARIIQGDALDVLRTLPAESVQCVVTSPPYFGLRDYGTAEWDGGADDCDHLGASHRTQAGFNERYFGKEKTEGWENKQGELREPFRSLCGLCGATRIDRQIGLESTPAEYVAKMIAVFREVRRVLRDDGVLWLNLGDSYAGSGAVAGGEWSQSNTGSGGTWRGGAESTQRRHYPPSNLKPKDLVGIPWSVAFALRADGWYLRQDIIWAKPNPMPESVTDRCTKAHEYIFLLSKSERYFYDAAAISEPFADERMGNPGAYKWSYANDAETGAGVRGIGGPSTKLQSEGWNAGGDATGRNKRSVWTIATEPYPEAHFATFPTELPRICILAGSKLGDTILDPFAGSGTTLQVALELSRAAIGIELNAEYVALANRRLNSTTLGLPLEIAA